MRSYIPQHYPSGEAYIQGEAMADLTTWATEVELFACAQLSGKDIFDVVDFTLEDYFTFVFILQLYKDLNVLNKIYYNYLQ